MFNQILCGNHLEILPRFPDDCFDMWLTSPPYDNLRSYEGYDFQFEPLARELYRVLKPGGVGVWIVNDATINGSETLTSFKQALFFKSIGFNVHDTMIYKNPGTGAKGSQKAYWQSFEYMFVFTKGGFLNTYNLLCDKPNKAHGHLNGQNNKISKMGHRVERNARRTPQFSIRQNVWEIPTGNMHGDSHSHPAPFPEKLAEDHILSWSNPGDVILDPMCGSGTTCKMAAKHGRKYVGIDIAEKYCDIARKRVALIEAQPLLFNENAGEQSHEPDQKQRAGKLVV